jgi:hypothetical protein
MQLLSNIAEMTCSIKLDYMKSNQNQIVIVAHAYTKYVVSYRASFS